MEQKIKQLNIITQAFYPDITATGELLYDLSVELKRNYNLDVSIITAQPNFVIKEKLKKNEIINNIKIKRLSTTSFDKNSFMGKVFNSWIFCLKTLFVCLFSQNADYYLIVTSPPLAPLIGTILKRLKGQKYIYLMHDVYPEIAWKLGYIKKDGVICKIWQFLTNLSLIHAQKIIVLSDDMKNGVLKRFPKVKEEDIKVIHNWANEEIMKVIIKEENRFVHEYDFQDKFVVEYSGNIGRIHEFKTMMDAAKELKDFKDIIFLFIGAGGNRPFIENLVKDYKLNNVLFIPYQKRENLTYSLGAADIHLVSLQSGYEELSAPSKLYGILASARPVIFIGSKDFYISKILDENNCGYNVEIGDYERLKQAVLKIKSSKDLAMKMGNNSRKIFEKNYTLACIADEYYNRIFSIKEN